MSKAFWFFTGIWAGFGIGTTLGGSHSDLLTFGVVFVLMVTSEILSAVLFPDFWRKDT